MITSDMMRSASSKEVINKEINTIRYHTIEHIICPACNFYYVDCRGKSIFGLNKKADSLLLSAFLLCLRKEDYLAFSGSQEHS